MPAEYFEARERALLGERYERLYAAPQETAARGVTVSALRTTPEEFAARADFPLRPSPFCRAAARAASSPPLCGGRGFWSATNTSRPGRRS